MNLNHSVLEEEPHLDQSRDVLHQISWQYPSVFRAAKFAAGSFVGFLDTEIILAAGTYFLYGKLSAPSFAFQSVQFVLINIISFVFGVTVTFFINNTLLIQNTGREINYGPRAIPSETCQVPAEFFLQEISLWSQSSFC